jgi:hypothetical protein
MLYLKMEVMIRPKRCYIHTKLHGVTPLKTGITKFITMRISDLNEKFIFRNVTPCCPANRCFGGMCFLHLQGWRLSQTNNQHEACNKSHSSWLTSQPWIKRKHVLPKRRWVSIRQHGIKCQPTVRIIATAVRTSHPATFSVVMPSILVDISRRFRRTCRLHFQHSEMLLNIYQITWSSEWPRW